MAAGPRRHGSQYRSNHPSPTDAVDRHNYTALDSSGSKLGARQGEEQLRLDISKLKNEDEQRKGQQLRDYGELTATSPVDSPRSVRKESGEPGSTSSGIEVRDYQSNIFNYLVSGFY